MSPACRAAGLVLGPILTMGLAPALHAQDFSLTQIQAPPASGVDAWLGPSVFSYPRYPGAAQSHTYVAPMLEVFGSRGWFLSSVAGAGWNFSSDKSWQYGLRLTPVFPRYARDTPLPPAVPDIGYRLERGAFLNYAPWEFLNLQSGLRQGSGRRCQGLLADVGATVGAPLGHGLTVALSGSTSWGNGHYVQSYFGAGQATGAGWVDTNADLMLLSDINPHWSLTLDLGRTHYRGDAASSPLVSRTTTENWFLGSEYRF